MFKALSFFLFLYILVPRLETQTIADIKLSLDFEQIDTFKNTTLRPLVEKYLNNLTIEGPIDLNLSLILSTATIQLKNIKLLEFYLDWDETQLQTVGQQSDLVSLQLFDADLKLESDYNITYLSMDLAGRANITIKNLTLDITLQFSNLSGGSGFYATIANFSMNYNSITMDVDSQIITWLIDKIFNVFKCVLIKLINSIVTGDLSQQVKELTSQIIQIPINPSSIINNLLIKMFKSDLNMPQNTGAIYILNISMTQAPFVRFFANSTKSFSYLTANIDISVYNNDTKATPYLKEVDLLPTRTLFDNDLQLYLCNSLLTQVQWIIIDSGILKLTLDDGMLPASSPLHLNTSYISLLLPGMTVKYGENKGIYLDVSAGSTFSKIVFRSGRLVGEVSLILDFYVDKDSTNYPSQGLAKCTNCEKALSLNSTLLLSLHSDAKNDSIIFVNLLNIDFFNTLVLEKTIEFDVNSFQTLMKDVGRSFIPVLNQQLDNIPNPLIGKFGITDFEYKFSVDYLFLDVKLSEDDSVKTILG